jgi:hypothetical protein
MLSTALHTSPHCIVPRLVRGRLGAAALGKSTRLLNVGHGDMQVRTEDHTGRSMQMKSLETGERCLDEGR